MRLAAFIGVVLTLLLLGAAAYLPGQKWQVALYAAIVVGTVALLALVSAVGEAAVGTRGRWVRALLSIAAGLFAAWVARSGRPGAVGELPFHDLWSSGRSILGLGAMLGALGLGASGLGGKHAGPSLASVVAVALGLYALWPWLRH